ncbi:ribonuclease Z [Candidatus Bathyarchaeota archaeon]|nr:ribonuclease Z [Candidatus Bathyarchaeota archaeon]
MEVIYLGTAGSFPTARRGMSAVAVQIGAELLLLDCGEGTQRQMALAKIGLKAKMKVLITHMHGDHVLGLPGILQTMALFDRTAPLRIFGPEGILAFVKAVKETVRFGLTYPIEVVEVQEGIVYEEKAYYVESARMSHPVLAFGYSINEKTRPGKFNPQKAKALDIPEGPFWGELQKGKAITTSNGRIVQPSAVTGQPRRGRKIVYTGDTSPCEATIRLAKDADLLIHEATFDDQLSEKALESGHSTPSQAAEVAKMANTKRLILTHISGRYPEEEGFLDRARGIFPETILAEDFMVLKVPLSD